MTFKSAMSRYHSAAKELFIASSDIYHHRRPVMYAMPKSYKQRGVVNELLKMIIEGKAGT